MLDPRLRRIAATLKEIPFPSRFAVEVCSECNLACTMCHHPSMRRSKGVMPLDLWKRCADEIAAVAPDTHCWFSFIGEPLLEPDRLFEMLDYGRSAGLRSLNVNTNGMPMTPEIADRLLDSPVDLVVIGLDGFSAATLEKIRVNARRDEVYANVEYLLEARRWRNRNGSKLRPEVQVQFIEMDENRPELAPFTLYWLERGASLKIRNKLSWGGRFDTPLGIEPEERIACPWAMTMMHVFWDGRVPRCPGDTEGDESVGNAQDEPLAVLWGRLGAYRQLHLQGLWDDLPPRCRTCKDWMTGAAQRVRPEARAETGRPTRPSSRSGSP